MSRRVRVLLVDDDQLVRAGLRGLVEDDDRVEVVGEAADGAEAVAQARTLAPDVICMDVRMPRVDGIQATRQILAGSARSRILVLTTFEHDEYVRGALEAGAHGFLLKRAAPESFVDAIVTVDRGDSLLFPESLRGLVASTGDTGHEGLPMLTAREGEVLRLMAKGLRNAEIADALTVSLETVKTHVVAILTKLDVRDRTQAVIRAYQTGFVPLP